METLKKTSHNSGLAKQLVLSFLENPLDFPIRFFLDIFLKLPLIRQAAER
jgi:hypothetical protein